MPFPESDEVSDLGEDLRNAVSELEVQLAVLKTRFDKNLYLVQDTNGNYIAAPILITLVQGYSALAILESSQNGKDHQGDSGTSSSTN